MSTKIENPGVYRGKIQSAGMGLSKNGYPQWAVSLLTTEKYISSPAEMEHFQITEPAWIDWSEFDEFIPAYLILYIPPTEDEPLTKDNALLFNCEQIQRAVGWDGGLFTSLNDDTHTGKTILFSAEPNTYNGETNIQVKWIDHMDASPSRDMPKLPDDKLAALNARLPAASPVHAKPSKPIAAVATKKIKATKKKAVKKTPPTAISETTEGCTMAEAWQYLIDHKGELSEDDFTQPWIDATDRIGPNLTDDDFTGAQWIKVRDSVVKALSLAV